MERSVYILVSNFASIYRHGVHAICRNQRLVVYGQRAPYTTCRYGARWL